MPDETDPRGVTRISFMADHVAASLEYFFRLHGAPVFTRTDRHQRYLAELEARLRSGSVSAAAARDLALRAIGAGPGGR